MELTRRGFLGGRSVGESGAWLSARGREHAIAAGDDPFDQAAGAATPLVRLNSNENPVGPSARVLDAVLRGLPQAGRYTDKAAITESVMVEAIAKANGVAAETIVWGPGSGELLAAAVRAFTSPDKPLVTAWPSFETPNTTARKIGAPVREVALDAGLAIDIDRMLEASKGAGLVFFCNPNNPTGTVHGLAAVTAFVTRAQQASPETVVLIDEAYHDYVTSAAYGTAAPGPDRPRPGRNRRDRPLARGRRSRRRRSRRRRSGRSGVV